MGGVALLARAAGHEVEGCDSESWPPMNLLLKEQGIRVREGYEARHLEPAPDLVLVGNAISRGNPALEHTLDHGIPYASGPGWLAREVLPGRWVLAVAGTHGKTTTAALLAWILEHAGLQPGFLLGGVPVDFQVSARLPPDDSPFFVIEADEYDTAFFDKRAKFVHYRPTSLLLNNLEYDHADIYPDLAAIQQQFHHLVRTVPRTGRIFLPAGAQALEQTLAMGCWSECQYLFTTGEGGGAGDWRLQCLVGDGSRFRILPPQELGEAAEVHWQLCGAHNMANALGAAALASHAGVEPLMAAQAASCFGGVERRLELRGKRGGVRVYDDFAHHPTAIRLTLEGLRAQAGAGQRVIAVLEPRSHTMRRGVHQEVLAQATAAADQVFWFCPPALDWDMERALHSAHTEICTDTAEIVRRVAALVQSGDRVVVMSNGGFEDIHRRLLDALDERARD